MHQTHKKECTKEWIITDISLIFIDIFLELYSAPFKWLYMLIMMNISLGSSDLLSSATKSNRLVRTCFAENITCHILYSL